MKPPEWLGRILKQLVDGLYCYERVFVNRVPVVEISYHKAVHSSPDRKRYGQNPRLLHLTEGESRVWFGKQFDPALPGWRFVFESLGYSVDAPSQGSLGLPTERISRARDKGEEPQNIFGR